MISIDFRLHTCVKTLRNLYSVILRLKTCNYVSACYKLAFGDYYYFSILFINDHDVDLTQNKFKTIKKTETKNIPGITAQLSNTPVISKATYR